MRFTALLLQWMMLVLLLIGEVACQSGQVTLSVRVVGLPADTAKLRVEIVPNGGTSLGERSLEGSSVQENFRIVLPQPLVTAAQVQVFAIDGQQCQLANGENSLVPGQTEITIGLADYRDLRCLLFAVKSGDGELSIENASWSSRLGENSYLYQGGEQPTGPQVGDEVTLHATPGIDSVFVGWGADCRGEDTNTCKLILKEGLTVVNAAFTPRRPCTTSGFCWLNPYPTGFGLHTVYGFSANDVWTAGEGGTVMHFNGGSWAPLTPITDKDLYGLWGRRPDDLWIVGQSGTVLRWNGLQLLDASIPTPNTFTSVWGATDGDVWIVGAGLLMRCKDDLSCINVPVPAWEATGYGVVLNVVYGTAADDVYFAGDRGTLLHWNGFTVESIPFPTNASLQSLWSSGVTGDFWVAANDGTLWHHTDAGFVNVVAQSNALRAVVGSPVLPGGGTPEVWALGDRGSIWRRRNTGNQLVYGGTTESLKSAWMSGPGDLWAVGLGGTLLHWDGAQFIRNGGGRHGLPVGRWGNSDGLFLAMDNNDVLHFSNSGWLGLDVHPSTVLMGLYGFPSQDLWGVGTVSALYRRTNSGWMFQDGLSGALFKETLYSLWGSSAADMWAVGTRATISHIKAGKFAAAISIQDLLELPPNPPLKDPLTLWSVWGSSATNVWTVGDQGLIAHIDGTNVDKLDFRKVGAEYPTFFSVWGSGPNDVWAAGLDGSVLHYSGTDWQPTSERPCPLIDGHSTNLAIYEIAGTGPNDIWFAGASNRTGNCASLYHWDGAHFCPVRGLPRSLERVWADTNGVFVAGNGGSVLYAKGRPKCTQ